MRPPKIPSHSGTALSSPKAFTLVELLTVISIMGILIGLLTLSVSGVRAKADQTTCVSNLRQVVTAVNLAATDGGGRYPTMKEYTWEPNQSYNVDGTPAGGSWSSPIAPWVGDVLAPYLAGSGAEPGKVLRCPSALKNQQESWLWDPQYTHYKYNVYYAQNKTPLYGMSQAMLFFDTVWPNWTPAQYSHSPGPAAEVNVAYADGHVAALSSTDYVKLNASGDESANDFFQFGWIKMPQ